MLLKKLRIASHGMHQVRCHTVSFQGDKVVYQARPSLTFLEGEREFWLDRLGDRAIVAIDVCLLTGSYIVIEGVYRPPQ